MTLQVPPLWLADITAYIPADMATSVLRVSNGEFKTGPSDTPASTWYNPVLAQPVDVARNLFAGGTTQGDSRVAIGNLVVNNVDGDLDTWKGYGFDGRALTLWVSTVYNPSYPADFTKVFAGTMATAEFSTTTITIKLRDLLATLNLPIQTTLYAGDNVLPDGLEGVASDLGGKPKPLLFGGPARNIPAPCVNTSKGIYQAHDGALASISAVYDQGRSLSVGFTWLTETSGFSTTDITGVVFGNGLWVAVGRAGTLATSSDGITWTLRTSGFGSTDIFNVAYGNGYYVAVGASGTIYRSATGTSGWTIATTPSFSTTGIFGVAFGTDGAGNPRFVAVGNTGKLATSSDGDVWTQQTSSFGTTSIEYAAYGGIGAGAQWVAVANAGKIATSPDGVTWTQQTNPFSVTAENLRAVVFGFDRWVVVGDTSGFGVGVLATSFDGITWTARTSTVSSLFTVAYGNGLFAAAGDNGIFSTSPDGVVWTAETTVFGTTRIRWLAYDGSGMFVMVGNSGTLAKTTNAAGTYANSTDLLDDTLAPARGTYKVYLAGGYFRIGSPPAGAITCDATQGTLSADRTAAQQWSAVLARTGSSAGSTAGDWSASDVATLDGLNSAVQGYWTMDPSATFLAVLDKLANSVGAAWWPDANGLFRIARFDAPSGSSTFTLLSSDFYKDNGPSLPTMNDPGLGLPVYRVVLRHSRNYTVQTTDLAGGVTTDRRGVLAQEWAKVTAEDVSVLTSNLLAPATDEETLYTNAADAQTEADRRLALRKVQRYRVLVKAQLSSATMTIGLNATGTLTHSRFGMSGGVLLRVLDIAPNASERSILLTLWGLAA